MREGTFETRPRFLFGFTIEYGRAKTDKKIDEEWVERQKKAMEEFDREQQGGEEGPVEGGEDRVMDGGIGERQDVEMKGAGEDIVSGGEEREKSPAESANPAVDEERRVPTPEESQVRQVPAIRTGVRPMSPVRGPAPVRMPVSPEYESVRIRPVMIAQGGKTKIAPPQGRRARVSKTSVRFRKLTASFRRKKVAGIADPAPVASGSRLEPSGRLGTSSGVSSTPPIRGPRRGLLKRKRVVGTDDEYEEEEEGRKTQPAQKRPVQSQKPAQTKKPVRVRNTGVRRPPIRTGMFFDPACIPCQKKEWGCEKPGRGRACVACGTGKVRCYWDERDAPPPRKRTRHREPVRPTVRKVTPESEDEGVPALPVKQAPAARQKKGKSRGRLLTIPPTH